MGNIQSAFQPIYTSVEGVKVLLTNKVQFQQDPSNLIEGELPNILLCSLIVRAETRVEMDLRSRYCVPFQSIRTGRFQDLPPHTIRAVVTAVDLRAVMEVLMTDFGRGTHINGENYYKGSKTEYNAYIDDLLGRNPEGANDKHDRFRFAPPLQDLKLAYNNSEADDGFKGMIINTDADRRGAETYAKEQINNPGATYINRRLDNCAGGGGGP